jgi:hypothetical protein
MKVNSTTYKGIEYVQVNALPADQKEKLLQTINRDLFIKILVDEKLVANCLLFKDYENWFENVYQVQRKLDESPNKVKPAPTGVPVESLKKA